MIVLMDRQYTLSYSCFLADSHTLDQYKAVIACTQVHQFDFNLDAGEDASFI